MLPVIPLVIAGGLVAAVAAFAASRKDESKALPEPDYSQSGEVLDAKDAAAAKTPGADVVLPDGAVPPGKSDPITTTPGTPDAPINSGAATPSPVGTGASSGAVSTSGVSADDSLDVLIAAAIAKKDVAALEKLAEQAQARGLLDVARSVRDEIARIKQIAPPVTPIGDNKPKAADISKPTGRAILSMKAGSRGPDVIEWQGIVGAKKDGAFGQDTHNRTVAWQKTKGLAADGIVGPKSWDMAYLQVPTLATTPRMQTAAPVISKSRPVLRQGLSGPPVKEWQTIVNSWLNTTGKNYAPLKVDSIFGAQTTAYTKLYQTAHGLTADGIVGPKTWDAGYKQVVQTTTAPAPVAKPVVTTPVVTPVMPSAVPESPTRQAAADLTAYLKGIGGLAARYKEDRNKVKGYQTKLGIAADGMYGRDAARAIMVQGLIPVAPFYWPKTNTAAAKKEFLDLVAKYAAADIPRANQWATLKSDTVRS